MARAVVLGGSGLIGSAVALRLLEQGWEVDITGRESSHVPASLTSLGVRFHEVDRGDVSAQRRLLGEGAELLVDTVCFTAADARALVPILGDVESVAMISSKAVYVDEQGRHANSLDLPVFDGPIAETAPTMTPGAGEATTRDGYGANKVAAEHVLLDSGHPVSVLRVGKAHGLRSARPREWMFVRRVLDRREAVLLADGGRGTDQTTAAANVAALVDTVARHPDARILNAADPDAPSVLEIAQTVASHLGHRWREALLEPDDDPALGIHPWRTAAPVVLDTSAARALGWQPAGGYADTVADMLDELVDRAAADTALFADDPFFAPLFGYAAEDAWLQRHP